MLQEALFTQIAEKYMDMIFRIAFNYLKDRTEADDVTQETLLRLYRTDKPFEGEAHIRNWLVRVTVNCCKKACLSPWRKREPLDAYMEQLSFTTPEHGRLFYMTMELPRKYRLAIYLYYYEDCTIGEIAEILHIPKATIATHLHRGRELLKKKLCQEEHIHDIDV